MSTSHLTPADRTALLHEINAIREFLVSGDASSKHEARKEDAIYTMGEIQRLVCNLGVPQRTHGSTFLELPVEIRLRISNFVLPHLRHLSSGQSNSTRPRQNCSSLLRTCHQIFEEASGEIYGRHRFIVRVDAGEIPGKKDYPCGQLRLLEHGLGLFHPDWQRLVGSKDISPILPLRHLRRLWIFVSVEHTISSCCNAQDLLYALVRHLRDARCCLKEVSVDFCISPRILGDKQWNDEDHMQAFCLEPFRTLLADSTREADVKFGDESGGIPRIRYRTRDHFEDDETGWQTLQPHSHATTIEASSSGTIYSRYVQAFRQHAVSPRPLWRRPRRAAAVWAMESTELSAARFSSDMAMFRRSHNDLIALMAKRATEYREACLARGGDQTSVDDRCREWREWLEIEDVLREILDGA